MSVNYNERADKRIAKAVQWVESNRRTARATVTNIYSEGDELEGYLKEDLEAPSDPLSDDKTKNRTTAKMYVYRGEGDDWKRSKDDDDEDEVQDVVNRDENFSASENDRIMVKMVNGEWRPRSGGGSPQKLVKIVNTGGAKRKSAAGQIMKIICEDYDPENEFAVAGLNVSVEPDSDHPNSITVINFTNSFLQMNGLYLCKKVSGSKFWVVENGFFAPDIVEA